MAKQTIENGESGLVVRTKLNDNFTEVYDKNANQDTTIAGKAPAGHNHAGVYEPVDATLLRNGAIGVSVEAYDASILKSSAIGVSVQGYDADTVKDSSYVHTDENFTSAEKSKLGNVADNANNYSHPATHPLAMIDGAGTAAGKDVGTGVGNVVELDSGGKLPAIDGSQLLNVTSLTADQQAALDGASSPSSANVLATMNDIAGFGSGDGDMKATTYDPSNKQADAFAMANMVEDTSHKILTGDERAAISSNTGKTGITPAQATAISNNTTHRGSTNNPHGVDADDVGLGNVDNTSDDDKPVSSAVTTALNTKSPTGHGHAAGDISGLGTAATENTGTSAGDVIALDGTGKLPSVDGSQLTNLPSGVSNLNDLDDVSGTATVGQVLTRKSGGWEPADSAGGSTATPYYGVFKDTNQVTIAGTAVTVPIDNVVARSSADDFTLASNELNIEHAGLYKISYLVNIIDSGSERGGAHAWLTVNGAKLNYSESSAYQRGYGDPQCMGTTIIITLAENDKIKIIAQRYHGSTSIHTRAGYSALVVDNMVVTGSGGGATSLNDLDDVSGTPTNNQVLTYNGTGWVPANASGGSSGDFGSVLSLVAAEDIPANSVVALADDGKAFKAVESIGTYAMCYDAPVPIGNPGTPELAIDPDTGVFVLFFKDTDEDPSAWRVVAGKYNGTDIDYGAAVTVVVNLYHPAVGFDNASGKFFVLWDYSSVEQSCVVSVNGLEITLGTVTSLGSELLQDQHFDYHTGENVTVGVFRSSASHTFLKTITITNNVLSLGTKYEIPDSATSYNCLDICYHPINGRFCVTYYNAKVMAVMVSISSGVMSFGTAVTASALIPENNILRLKYDSGSQYFAFVFNPTGSNPSKLVTMSVSGTTLTVEASANISTHNSNVYCTSICSYPAGGYIVVMQEISSSIIEFKTATLSSSTITFGTAQQMDYTVYIEMEYDPIHKCNIQASIYGGAKVRVLKAPVTLGHLQTVGYTVAGASSGASADVLSFGSTIDTLSGLTIGETYYVKSDGTLTTDSTFGNIPLGRALSATELEILSIDKHSVDAVDPDEQYVAKSDYTASDVLTKLLTVDGGTSGIDAQYINGVPEADLAKQSDLDYTNSKLFSPAEAGEDFVVGDAYAVGSNGMLGKPNLSDVSISEIDSTTITTTDDGSVFLTAVEAQNCFVVLYYSGTTVYAKIFRVVNDVVTVGSAITIYTAADEDLRSICTVTGTSKIAIFGFRDADPTFETIARILTVDAVANTITVGAKQTPLSGAAGTSYQPRHCVALSTGNVAVNLDYNGDWNHIRLATISGDTVTFNGDTSMMDAAVRTSMYPGKNAGEFIVIYANGSMHVWTYRCSITTSATTIEDSRYVTDKYNAACCYNAGRMLYLDIGGVSTGTRIFPIDPDTLDDLPNRDIEVIAGAGDNQDVPFMVPVTALGSFVAGVPTTSNVLSLTEHTLEVSSNALNVSFCNGLASFGTYSFSMYRAVNTSATFHTLKHTEVANDVDFCSGIIGVDVATGGTVNMKGVDAQIPRTLIVAGTRYYLDKYGAITNTKTDRYLGVGLKNSKLLVCKVGWN